MKHTPLEIHDQFKALSKTVAELRRREGAIRELFGAAAPKALVCVGCGSSYMLSKSMASIANLMPGVPAYAFAAGDVWATPEKYRGLFEGAVVLALSRSGATSEVMGMLEEMRKVSAFRLLSVVCVEGSPLETASDLAITLPWAFDNSVCQTRCVTNMYAAGAMAVSYGADRPLDEAFARVAEVGDGYLADNEEALRALGAKDWTRAVVLADGEIDGIAEEGALAFNEICQLPSNYHHILDVRHGPMVLVRPDTLAIVLRTHTGDCDAAKREERLIADLVAKGATVVVCASGGAALPGVAHHAAFNGGDLPHAALGAAYLCVCQLLSYHKSTVNGCDPDAPEGLSAWIKL